MSEILVVAAHPDDEILGVGATIAKRIKSGDRAFALILGEGQTSRWERREDADLDVVRELHKTSIDACTIIGYEEIFFESLPDNRFDLVALLDVIKCVEKYVSRLKPEVVYTHHAGDLNIDHRITCQAVLTATRPIGKYPVKEIYGFETVSSTEWNFGKSEMSFVPQVYEDITDTFRVKCESMQKYKSELCEFPHPRSIQMLNALAQMRGATVGVEYAEAFEVLRIVR